MGNSKFLLAMLSRRALLTKVLVTKPRSCGVSLVVLAEGGGGFSAGSVTGELLRPVTLRP